MKYILISILFMFVASGNAQTIAKEKQARQAVMSFAGAKYPAARSKWLLDLIDGYRLSFKLNTYKYTARFSQKGEWISTERSIRLDEIPAEPKKGFENTPYSKAKVLSVVEQVMPKQPDTLYQIELRYDKHNADESVTTEDHKLYFTASGVLTKDELEPDNSLPYLTWR